MLYHLLTHHTTLDYNLFHVIVLYFCCMCAETDYRAVPVSDQRNVSLMSGDTKLSSTQRQQIITALTDAIPQLLIQLQHIVAGYACGELRCFGGLHRIPVRCRSEIAPAFFVTA